MNPPTAIQKDTLRKTTHSAIEKRRRERINDKIAALKLIVPSCALSTVSNMHKLTVLQNTIDYVQELEQTVMRLQASQSRDYQGVANQRLEYSMQSPEYGMQRSEYITQRWSNCMASPSTSSDELDMIQTASSESFNQGLDILSSIAIAKKADAMSVENLIS